MAIGRAQLAAWYSAARPRTLTATYVPLGLAAVIAIQQNNFRLLPFLLSLLGALLLQAGANLINEYFDYKRGADELKQAGQGMTIKNNVLTPELVLMGAVATVGAGILIGLYLLTISGPELFWIGLGGVLVVILYTAGPFPLAYNGLGEIAVFIFMGPVMVLGAYFVMARQLDWLPVVAALPFSFTVAAILHANNIRDMDADRAVNKRTLAVRFGLVAARREYRFLIYTAYASLIVLVLLRIMPPTTLLGLLTVPEARRLITLFDTSTDVALLHQGQGRTAKMHGRFGLLIVAGWALWLLLEAVVRGSSGV